MKAGCAYVTSSGAAECGVADLFLADQRCNVIQRGNNREAIFFGEEDDVRHHDWLVAAAAEYGRAVHGYVLMTNHVHLWVTPHAVESLPRTMQSLGRRHVRHTTRLSPDRTLWEGAIAPRRSMRSVRPRLLPHHRAHAQGAADTLRPVMISMIRQGRRACRTANSVPRLFVHALDEAFVDSPARGDKWRLALGDARSKRQIEGVARGGVGTAAQGRLQGQSATTAIKSTLTPISPILS